MPGGRELGLRLTLEQRQDAPEGDRAALGVLAQGELEEEEWEAGEDQIDEVGYKERS
jgi:hypothetical protein